MDKLGKIGGAKLGWGLLVAWLFATFYTGIVPTGGFSDDPAAPASVQMLDTTLSLIFVILTICALIVAERKKLAFLRSAALPVLAGLLVAAGTLLGALAQGPAAAVAADMLTGIGSSALWMLWGEEYTRDQDGEIEEATLASAVLAIALIGIVYASPTRVLALAIVAVLPVASALLLRRSRQGNRAPERQAGATARGETPDLAAFWGVFFRSGAALFLMCAFLSLLQGLCPDLGTGSPTFVLGLLASVLFVLAVGCVSFSGPRRVSVSFLFRWAVPLVVTGFALIVLFGAPTGYELAFDVSIMGRLAFWVITQLYFSRFVERGVASPMAAYGVGWLFLHLGDLVGTWVSVPVAALVSQGGVAVAQVASACIICVAVCSLIPFGRDSGYGGARGTGREGAGQDAPVEEQPQSGAQTRERQPDAYEEKLEQIAAEYKLTPRETEIFGLLMHGRSIPFIRDELVISRDTVATHVKHIYSKTGVHSRQELLDLAE